MKTRLNLLHPEGEPILSHYYKVVRNFVIRTQVIEPIKKMTPTMPKRKGSVIAAVLAELLSGADVNSIVQADQFGSSPLKDHISNLRKRHGWEAIQSHYVGVVTAGGMIQWRMQYWMPLAVLKLYDNEEIRIWINEVRLIRRNKRADYKGPERRAKRYNARQLNERIQILESRKLAKRGRA